MSWTLLFGLVLSLTLALLAALQRRGELARMASAVQARDTAVRHGADKAQLQHPVVDLSRCLGCGTCVAACPEDGVLEIVHGQAIVARGARCVGVSACERECPVGAITVTLGDVRERNDIPVLSEGLEAVGTPGLFLAGEVTAHALIKTAIDHGTAVAAEVARRAAEDSSPEVLDLIVVGAGPAGIACSLEAKRHGLRFLTLDQEESLGGTVAKYPRAKLVLTQPIELPLYGKFKASSYSKEELIELWQRVATEQELPIQSGESLQGVQQETGGSFVVQTQNGSFRARHVCLALGRRGTPRRLEVPGADLPKVQFDLLDARGIQNTRVAVVGGGDSAVETALAVAAQPGNHVTLIHRKESFFRIRARNEERLQHAIESGALQVLTQAEVTAVHPDRVDVHVARGSGIEKLPLPNDRLYVQIGGTPPFELLQRSGVSFDPELLQAEIGHAGSAEAGTGLVRALAAGLVLTLAALGFALWHFDYYSLPRIERPAHPKHASLRPGQGIGLALGIASVALILVNLAYLLRRSPKFRFSLGSLQLWMTSHVATGILALLCALLHAAMSARNTIGGHAFWMLALLMVTGAIGRYLYAWVPRAANGRELQLTEVKARLASLSADWDGGQRRFRENARVAVEALVERKQWKTGFAGRALALLGVRRDLKKVLQELETEGLRHGVTKLDVLETQRLARKAHRTALMAAHYEDLRALMSTWRWLHRWAAALMVLLVILHVIYAVRYGSFFKASDPGGLL